MTYVLSGYKWGSPTNGESGGQVFWSIEDLSALQYDDTLYDASDFKTALQDAFDAWEAVASIDFTYTEDVDAADMTIDAYVFSDGAIGRAYMRYYTGGEEGELFEASVSFDSGEDWAPYGETDLDFHAVALHEIGHAIGLDHTEDDTDQIMYPWITALNELGPGDVDGAQTIYGEYDADARTADPRDWIDGEEFVDETPEEGPPPHEDAAEGGSGGGDAGGILALLLGLLAVLIGGAAGPLVALAAAMSPDDAPDTTEEEGDHPHDHDDSTTLEDLFPNAGTIGEGDWGEDEHLLYADGFHDHDHSHEDEVFDWV